ncbi:oligosaccharide repeat unit polymerase [Deinococcus depolymerans]|uniref:oligosaccharide repeat unit polymerase n=1 Tax=Deinococcus depolymerans TaxID=392408 RepID=UPI00309B6DFE
MLSKIFDPGKLFFIQALIVLIYILNKGGHQLGTYLYIFLPVIVFLPIYAWFNKITAKYAPKPTLGVVYTKMAVIFSMIYANVCFFILILVYSEAGGFGGALKMLADAGGVSYFQQDFLDKYGIFYISLYAAPAIITINAINFYSSSQSKKMLACLSAGILVIIFGISILLGSRILIISACACWLMVFLRLGSVKRKHIGIILISLIISLYFIVQIQTTKIRTNSISEVFDVLIRYYTTSFDNGIYAIERLSSENPLFWTIRPLLTLPIFSDLTNIQSLYAGLFGTIPILSRKDDFDYVWNMGLDPTINTFSYFGYLFLDYGWYGAVVNVIILILLQILFVKNQSGNIYSLLLFPIFYIALLDHLRTINVFSQRTLISCIVIAVYIALVKAFSLRRSNET